MQLRYQFLAIALVVALLLAIDLSGIKLTGNIITKASIVSENLSISTNQSMEYTWSPKTSGSITSLRATANIIFGGRADLYIEKSGTKILILNGSKIIPNSILTDIDIRTAIDSCENSCSLSGFDSGPYKLIFDVENSTVVLNSVSYGLTKTIDPDKDIEIKDKDGNKKGKASASERADGKIDLDIDSDNGRDMETKIRIKGADNLPDKINARIDMVSERKDFSTEVVAMDKMDMEYATVILLKTSATVNAILECPDFDLDSFSCPTKWKKTGIRFVDNGDTVAFNVTHFSGYVGGIINITKADHLDSGRIFISDISNQTMQLDDIWSETIPSGDYVRVAFQQNLTNKNDITIYSRTINGTPRVEVYEIDGTNPIAEFSSLNDNQYNKVYLTNLQGIQDRFDLKILGGSVEFDYIVDPNTAPNAPILNAPTNNTVSTSTNRLLNITVADPEADSMDISIYGDNSTAANLIAFFQNVANGSSLTYNWTSPTVNTVFQIPNSNLALYWNFDKNTSDFSGNGRTGTISGATLNVTNGKLGGAYNFSGSWGSTKFISVSNPGTMASGSYVLWVKPKSTNAENGWIDSNFDIFQWSGSLVYFRTGAQTSVSISSWSANTWHHVAMTWNSTNYYGYLDGVRVVSSTQSGSRTGDISVGRLDTFYPFNGAIDEVGIFNRTLSDSEILDLYRLQNDTYYWKAEANDSLLLTTSETRKFVVNNDALFPLYSLNSTNTTTAGAMALFSLLWNDTYFLDSYIFALDNGTGAFVNDSPVAFNAGDALAWSNVSRKLTSTGSARVAWRYIVNDTTGNTNISENFTFTTAAAGGNNPPSVPNPVLPANGSSGTIRNITIVWNVSTDTEGDAITYTLNVDNDSDFSSPEVNVTGLTNTTLDNVSYTTQFLDVDKQYFWRVNANDSAAQTAYSGTSNFTINSLIAISFITDIVNFTLMSPGVLDNTADDNPLPLMVENTGNVFVNLSITGTQFFVSGSFPSSSYQFLIDANETNAFLTSASTITWTNVPSSSSTKDVVNLNWSDSTDNVEIHINISVPGDEPGGKKSSVLTVSTI